MPKTTPAIIATLFLSVSGFAQVADTPLNAAVLDSFQVRYVANLSAGDAAVNLTNSGSNGGFDPAGDMCANVYVFAQDQQLTGCCACPLTPNHLKTLSVQKDLISNTLTPGIPTAITVALVATVGGGTCNAATIQSADLRSGLRAWGTSLHVLPGGGFGVGETEFSPVILSKSEFTKLTSYCGFIQAIGSGYGICGSCRNGASGAERQ